MNYQEEIKDIFNLEDPFDMYLQYKLYLKLIGANETAMGEVQRSETRKAFMAGMAQMYTIMTVDIPKLEAVQAVNKMELLEKEIIKFWHKINVKENPNIN